MKKVNSQTAATRLLSGIERIERIEEERKELAADIKDIKGSLRSDGFDIKAINQMLRERRMSTAERQEWQAICDVYRASLGMLDGTPLGDHARDRLLGKGSTASSQAAPPEDDDPPDETVSPAPEEGDRAGDDHAEEERSVGPTPENMLTARAEGGAAALAGRSVTSNPYPAGDGRRASWDEGWCASNGSDGMDIPAAFRRTTEKKRSGAGRKGQEGA